MSIGPPIPEIQHFPNLTLKIQGQGQMTMMLHNYRSGQFHRTSNGINPYRGFRDMGSAKSCPSAAWFDKFLAHGQAHMGQMGKWPWQCTATGLDNSTELRMEKIHQAVTEIRVPQVWQPPDTPTATGTVTTIPLQPGGLMGKKAYKTSIGEIKNTWRNYQHEVKTHETESLLQPTTYIINYKRIPNNHGPLRFWSGFSSYNHWIQSADHAYLDFLGGGGVFL